MAIVARLKTLLARCAAVPGLRGPRPATMALGAVTSVCAWLAIAALPAQAIVREVVAPTKAGLQPRSAPPKLGESTPGEPEKFRNPSGNPVLHANAVYGIYWDPTDHYHGDWQNLIDTFFHDLGAASGSLANVFAVDAQYTDRTNQPAYYRSSFRGAYTDTDGYPAPTCVDPAPEAGVAITCLTDKQVREELSSFISQHGLPKGMGTIYYVLTPPGATVCLDAGGATGHCSDYAGKAGETSYENSFCSYHAAISPTNPTQGDANTILYGMIPWTAGGLGNPETEQKKAFDCQDGGFDPSSKPVPEKKEKPKEKTTKEEEEFLAKTKEEKEIAEKKEELEGPHQEEPNQLNELGPDGYWDHGLADLIINQIAVEQQNIVTNPLLNAWQDSVNNELTDECRNHFFPPKGGSVTASEFTGAGTLSNQVFEGGGNYYLNDAFNLAGLRLPYPGPGVTCPAGVSLAPAFTSPSPVNVGEIVGFDGMESDILLNAAYSYSPEGAPQSNYATYLWNFGDGSPAVSGYAPGAPACSSPWLSPCAASVFHTFTYGGTYNVTLTVTDVARNERTASRLVTVLGPPPPAPPAAPGSAPGAGAQGANAAAKPPVIIPTVAAVVSSHSLRSVLRRGLVVRYAVSERVTGRFEVLIASSLARQLGLRGQTATGLPQGTPAQTVIGNAFLVTTSGGRNSVRIKFSKSNATRLARLHGVSLMLRIVVRNATTGSATVLSTIPLSR